MAEPESWTPEGNDITDEQSKKMAEFSSKVEGQVIRYRKADKGECWSLPYAALEAAGAALPCERGNCKGNAATYEWGRKITSAELRTGDIIQINGKTRWVNGVGHEDRFKHHSMVVLGREGRIVTVAQQWVDKPVHIQTYDLDQRKGGNITYYRPGKAKK